MRDRTLPSDGGFGLPSRRSYSRTIFTTSRDLIKRRQFRNAYPRHGVATAIPGTCTRKETIVDTQPGAARLRGVMTSGPVGRLVRPSMPEKSATVRAITI